MREGETCLGGKNGERLRQVFERKAGRSVCECGEDVTMLGCTLTKNRANSEVIPEIQ